MAGWLGLSLELRCLVIGLFGVLIAPVINWAIYNIAYFPRPVSPWGRRQFQRLSSRSRLDRDPLWLKKPERWLDHAPSWGWRHLPIVGWLMMRREADLWGRLFWLRPLAIELLFPLFLVWLYRYEIDGNLLPRLAIPPSDSIQGWLHLQFVAHAILCVLMCVATFIDFDELTIPDGITIPGTLFALAGSACFLNWHLPTDMTHPHSVQWPTPLVYDAPRNVMTFEGRVGGVLAVACYTVWCFAMADRRWITRRGIGNAIRYFLAGLVRHPSWRLLAALWLIGTVAIVVAWLGLSPLARQSLLSSCLGMVVGGFTVWIIRIVAGAAIGVEALGFGDVTLMAMVGAFIGWQPTMIAFFLSPVLALFFVLVRYLVTGDNQTPFGPYLCGGVVVTLVCWDPLWNGYFQDMLDAVGPILFWILFAGLLLMGGLLWTWRLLKSLFA